MHIYVCIYIYMFMNMIESKFFVANNILQMAQLPEKKEYTSLPQKKHSIQQSPSPKKPTHFLSQSIPAESSHQHSMRSGAPLIIKSKTQHIKELMLKKGYLKVRIHFPELKKSKYQETHKIIGIDITKSNLSKVLLVPSMYTMMQLRSEIRLAYKIRESQAIFIFVNSEKITDAGAPLKDVYEKYVKGGQGIGCLELNAYTTEGF